MTAERLAEIKARYVTALEQPQGTGGDRLIAHAPLDIPWLLAEIERLQAGSPAKVVFSKQEEAVNLLHDFDNMLGMVDGCDDEDQADIAALRKRYWAWRDKYILEAQR